MGRMKSSILYFVIGPLIILLLGLLAWRWSTAASRSSHVRSPYSGNIIQATRENTYFRRVIFTGNNSQLVVMDIKPGEDVGEETHYHVEQTLFLLSGTGVAVLNGVRQPFKAGDVVVVTPGTKHNFINTGTDSLKIYTMYSPPNHIDGRIQKTKSDAIVDTADEEFGSKVE